MKEKLEKIAIKIIKAKDTLVYDGKLIKIYNTDKRLLKDLFYKIIIKQTKESFWSDINGGGNIPKKYWSTPLEKELLKAFKNLNK